MFRKTLQLRNLNHNGMECAIQGPVDHLLVQKLRTHTTRFLILKPDPNVQCYHEYVWDGGWEAGQKN